MPCDSIVLNTVDLPRMNHQLGERAIAVLGWVSLRQYYGPAVLAFVHPEHGRFRVYNGVLTGLDGQSDRECGIVADQLKQSYSAEVVKYTAARNGWKVRQVSAFQFEVIK